ncbi:GerW family sporulation protein [Ammoniphilus sp. CFH 90114]|uniref:GerW family sporulation protein n=1 Tax=Ammoniphilus sp. CFH 90114 TaxID=2493665 RepID=UPI00100F08C7|nr:GerW family sporulation protein [Ammoniphilus sp. CFH 90114]RXT13576.1 sporulation protein YtfJ [Ammoniphilus sp. CFH 90114]
MAEHPIQGLMQTAMENLKEMVDVNTIVGDPVETPDGSVILPISKVGFGFAAGGSEFEYEVGKEQGGKEMPFGGGSGGGVSITPVAFLVVGKNGIKTIPLEGSNHLYDRIMDMAPQFLEKFQSMMGKNKGQGSGRLERGAEDPFDIQ